MEAHPTSLRVEIQQARPFASPAEEAGVGLLRTADTIQRALAAAIEPSGITTQQYNVLRILRGAHPEPLPTLELGARMIEQSPGVTRLLDRLVAKGLVRRQRCRSDRRQVHCWITDDGLALLAGLDEPVRAALKRGFRRLRREETTHLSTLLDRIRDGFRTPADEG